MAKVLPSITPLNPTPAPVVAKLRPNIMSLDQYFNDQDTANCNDFLLIFDKSSTDGKVWYLILDDSSKRPKPLPKTNFVIMNKLKDIYGYRVVVLEHKLYILGGRHRQSGSYLGHTFKYDPKTHSWTRKCSMNKGRSRFGAVILDGCIYVCGGEGRGGRMIDSVECYDPKADIWVNMQQMPRPRADHAVCVADKKIFVSGGVGRAGSSHIRKGGTNIFWNYDPYSDRWATGVGSSLLPWTLESHCMVSLKGRIFCFGGMAYKKFHHDSVFSEKEHDSLISFSVEKGILDLRIDGNWETDNPNILTPRACAGSLILGHNIYIIGGRNMTRKRCTPVVEYYNTRKKKWYHAFDLPKEMGDYANVDIVHMKIPTENKEFSALGRALLDKWVMW